MSSSPDLGICRLCFASEAANFDRTFKTIELDTVFYSFAGIEVVIGSKLCHSHLTVYLSDPPTPGCAPENMRPLREEYRRGQSTAFNYPLFHESLGKIHQSRGQGRKGAKGGSGGIVELSHVWPVLQLRGLVGAYH